MHEIRENDGDGGREGRGRCRVGCERRNRASCYSEPVLLLLRVGFIEHRKTMTVLIQSMCEISTVRVYHKWED